MTLDEQIGQLFILGFEGTAPTTSLTDWLKMFRPGGVLLLGRNITQPAQLLRLTTGLQATSPGVPLLIGVDQEGGKVSRLLPPFTQFPGQPALGLCRLPSLAYAFGEVTAEELRAVGCNLNFTPVLDVLTNPKNPVINGRAFGADPLLVSELGLAVVAGLQDHGVLACGKHFPGHGDTETDSHKTLPTVTCGLDRMREVELRPFVHAIENGLEVLMTAHVVYEKLDPKHPATLSPAILTELLRQTFKFDGLIISDDLTMHAITDHVAIEQAAVQAFLAGVDLLLIAHDRSAQEQARGAVVAAVKKGTISGERLEESLARIRRVKTRHLSAMPAPSPAKLKTIIGAAGHQMVAREIIEKSRLNGARTAAGRSRAALTA